MKVAGSPTLQETQKNTQNGPFKIPSSKRTTQTHANSQKTQTDRYFFFGGHAILPKGETFSATCFSEMGELFRFKKKIRLFRTPTYYLLFLIVSSSFFSVNTSFQSLHSSVPTTKNPRLFGLHLHSISHLFDVAARGYRDIGWEREAAKLPKLQTKRIRRITRHLNLFYESIHARRTKCRRGQIQVGTNLTKLW